MWHFIVMLAACAVFLLCWVSVSRSAPLACEDLVRPSNQPDLHHVEGRWVFVAGSLSYLPFIERLRQRDSSAVRFSTNGNKTDILFSRSMRSENKCYYTSTNISLEGSSFIYDNGSVNITFMHTSCHDCILLSCDVDSGTRQHFYLFSKRRQLEEKEMEEFRAQVECLNMPPPVVMDPTKQLCPEETADDQTEEKIGEQNS
uniref:Uncharacterized protein n=1 Tax=Acanthochromis polyacanthus TaxID=80966 RepID=A0A3Q1F768_9TELE